MTAVVTPAAASIFPNFEYNERSTVVMFGRFGNRLDPDADLVRTEEERLARWDAIVRIRALQVQFGASGRAMENRRSELRGLARGLPADPNRLLEGAVQRLDNASERMTGALRLWVERKRAAIPDLRPGPLRADIARRRAAFAELPPRLARALARGRPRGGPETGTQMVMKMGPVLTPFGPLGK